MGMLNGYREIGTALIYSPLKFLCVLLCLSTAFASVSPHYSTHHLLNPIFGLFLKDEDNED
jgi:hypothetical protein